MSTGLFPTRQEAGERKTFCQMCRASKIIEVCWICQESHQVVRNISMKATLFRVGFFIFIFIFLRRELTLHSHYDAIVTTSIRIFILHVLSYETWDAKESKLLLRCTIIKMFHARLIFLNVESGLCNDVVGHGTRAL